MPSPERDLIGVRKNLVQTESSCGFRRQWFVQTFVQTHIGHL